MKRCRDREHGFALAESIAVLALSALILLTLLIATDLVSRNSAAAARRATDLEMLATGLAALRRDLEGALNVAASGEPGSSVMFSGGPGSVGLLVEDDRSSRDNSESLVWVETRYRDGEGALVRSSAPLLPGIGSFDGVRFGDSALLAVGPWRYRFSYAQEDAGRVSWSGSLSGRLPAAIRLEVLESGGERAIPALTVRVNISSAGCAAGGCDE